MLCGCLIRKVGVPPAHRKLLHHPWKTASHCTFINYRKDKPLMSPRVELSHSPSAPGSKCVFSKRRKWRMETFGLHREALRATGLPPGAMEPRRQQSVGRVRGRRGKRLTGGPSSQQGSLSGGPSPPPPVPAVGMKLHRPCHLKLTLEPPASQGCAVGRRRPRTPTATKCAAAESTLPRHLLEPRLTGGSSRPWEGGQYPCGCTAGSP